MFSPRLSLAFVAFLSAAHFGCGGGSTPVSPAPTPTPVAASPDPGPTPTPTPCPPGEECSTNRPVVRVSLRIYRAWDNKGHLIEPPPNPYKQVLREPVPVGYQFLFDVVGRGEDGHDTQGDDGGAGIVFHPSDPFTWSWSTTATGSASATSTAPGAGRSTCRGRVSTPTRSASPS